ncbi:MAG TPA: sugar phosphate nucleotidyltransferase [Candidatus Cloacimonas sp.]|nr:sugar phosphate nucleotidyltransferase [Candidatus Cloacimonas sp.]
MNDLAAIILAAGKGTRMKSERAKVTMPIADKPMIQRVVNTALATKCNKVFIVVGYMKNNVIAALEDNERIEFVEQQEQLGTGNAVIVTEPMFTNYDQDVLILCGDVPLLTADTLIRLYEKHKEEQASCTILTAFLDDPGKYGRILRNNEGEICGIKEFKDATDEQRKIKEWNTGIYCFKAKDLFTSLKQTSNNNHQGEYYLTDTVEILSRAGKKISNVVLEDLMEVSGVNSQEELAALEDIYIGRIRKKWLNNGVIIHNPASVYIGDDVIIEPDVEIYQNTVIKGKCTLEKGCIIGPCCLLENSDVSTEAIMQGYNVLVNAVLPEHHILHYGSHIIEETQYE